VTAFTLYPYFLLTGHIDLCFELWKSARLRADVVILDLAGEISDAVKQGWSKGLAGLHKDIKRRREY